MLDNLTTQCWEMSATILAHFSTIGRQNFSATLDLGGRFLFEEQKKNHEYYQFKNYSELS